LILKLAGFAIADGVVFLLWLLLLLLLLLLLPPPMWLLQWHC